MTARDCNQFVMKIRGMLSEFRMTHFQWWKYFFKMIVASDRLLENVNQQAFSRNTTPVKMTYTEVNEHSSLLHFFFILVYNFEQIT